MERGRDDVGDVPLTASNLIIVVNTQISADPYHLSPRPTDPMRYHGYFVDPMTPTETPEFHFFIHPDRWAALQSEAEAGRCSGCSPRSTWGHKYPGVLVHDGVVVDVMARFQGSRYNRKNGVSSTDGSNYPNKPSSGAFRAISWRFALPPCIILFYFIHCF